MTVVYSVPVALRSCEVCGRTFTCPKSPGKYPVTCGDECKRARGKSGAARMAPGAARKTGVMELGGTGRHSRDDGLAQALHDAIGSAEHEGRTVLAGSTVAGDEPVYDEATGEYKRDGAGRVVTRWRNYWNDSNLIVDVPVKDTPVLGARHLPWDWQERIDAGESLDDIRFTSWLGVGLDALYKSASPNAGQGAP